MTGANYLLEQIHRLAGRWHELVMQAAARPGRATRLLAQAGQVEERLDALWHRYRVAYAKRDVRRFAAVGERIYFTAPATRVMLP
jgi:hypothetical protein